MSQKHLHEFLQHVQDPFLLKNYIADRRSKLKRCNSSPVLHHDHDHLQIPSSTAALLLESALRIFHHQSSTISPTPKFQNLGLFRTLFNNLLKNPVQNQPDEEERRVPFCLSLCKGATFNRLSSPPLPPAAAPIRRRYEFFNGAKIQLQGLEEDKELRSSPVSVLETNPFKDEDEDIGEDKKKTIQSLFCWYEEKNTDTKKQKLLLKLKRFERLDPRELDKTLGLSTNELRRQEEEEDRFDDEFEVMDMIVDVEMGREVEDGGNDSEEVAIEIEISIYEDLIYDLLNDFFFIF